MGCVSLLYVQVRVYLPRLCAMIDSSVCDDGCVPLGACTHDIMQVTVTGKDGRAGMAALTLRNSSDSPAEVAAGLAPHCIKNLPIYAVPVFLRFLPEYVCFFIAARHIFCRFLFVGGTLCTLRAP